MKRLFGIGLTAMLFHAPCITIDSAMAQEPFTGNTITVNYDNNHCYPNGKCIATGYVHTYRFTRDGSLFSYRRDGGGVHFRPGQKTSTDKSVEKLNGHDVPLTTRSTYSVSGNRFKIKDITRYTYSRAAMPQLSTARGESVQTIEIQVRIDGRKCTVGSIRNHLKMPPGFVISRQFVRNAKCRIGAGGS